MTVKTNDEIIEKIKKLLTLADKNSNSSEAEVAMLKAQELMAKHGVSVELSNTEEIEYSEQVCKHKWDMGYRKPLGIVIAQNFRCKTWIQRGSIVFYGHKLDAQIAKEVFEYAYSFAYTAGNAQYNRAYQMGKETKGVFNSYVTGFIKGISQKLEEQSTALMVVTPNDVIEKFNDMSSKWKSSKGGMRGAENFDREAFEDGVKDGRQVMNSRRLS